MATGQSDFAKPIHTVTVWTARELKRKTARNEDKRKIEELKAALRSWESWWRITGQWLLQPPHGLPMEHVDMLECCLEYLLDPEQGAAAEQASQKCSTEKAAGKKTSLTAAAQKGTAEKAVAQKASQTVAEKSAAEKGSQTAAAEKAAAEKAW